jgi:phage terminase small subunit
MADKEHKLTAKQQAFVNHYLNCMNATEAAKLAGYSEKTARSMGSENLTKPDIAAVISAELQARHMGKDEVLTRLADIARGDIGQLMDVSGFGFNFDMSKAKAAGLTKLIKRVKQKTTIFIAKKEDEQDREVHEIEIELYDAQSATVTIGKQHGLFSTKVEIKDWREEARKDGYDPDKLKSFTRDQFVSAMVGGDGEGSVPGSETDSDPPAPGAGDGG